MKKRYIFIILGIFLLSLPFILADQVLWDNDSDIEIYDTWRDIDGTPLTGADCSWIVYNPNMSINQSGNASEFAVGIFNFTVNQLPVIEIYPLLINCSKNSYNGTSSLREIKIIDELAEEYKDRLVQINETTQQINETVIDINITITEVNTTTHDIYDYLTDTINVTLNSVLNLTNLTYEEIIDLDANLTNLVSTTNNLRTYLEEKWGNENADKIMEKLKDINSGVSYLKSEYYYLSASARSGILLSIKQDTRESLAYFNEEKFNIWIWIIPGTIILLLIILVVYLFKRKSKTESFGGEING